MCSFPTEKCIEISRGDVDSDSNIRKRMERSQSSSNWCSGRLWRTGDHQRRHLTGRRRLHNTLQQGQAGGEDMMETEQSQSEEDSQDVIDWGQSTHGG